MFYLIDKPADISSFGVIRKLRKILDIKKIGHVGTLDPFATGCLLIATGKSTKLIPLLEGSKKEYITTIRFDGKTESYDTETPIVSVDTSVYRERSKEEIETFLLSQKEQIPPKYSAIHIDGKRSYELARKGKEVVLEKRKIEVYEAEVLKIEPFEIHLRMIVSSGCYIRSFGPLLGRFLGTDGGYLTRLRRLSLHGTYYDLDESSASDLDNLCAIPISKLFHTIHTIMVDREIMEHILHGRNFALHDSFSIIKNREPFFIMCEAIPCISLCKIEDKTLLIIKNDVGE